MRQHKIVTSDIQYLPMTFLFFLYHYPNPYPILWIYGMCKIQ